MLDRKDSKKIFTLKGSIEMSTTNKIFIYELPKV